MTNYTLCWIDERLFDSDCEEIKEYWKSQNEDIYFNRDECIINIEEKEIVDAQIKALELVEELGLEVWSLTKSEVILTEEVELK